MLQTLFFIAVAACMTFSPVSSKRYTYEKGPVSKELRAPCPGFYCGRQSLNSTHVSGCGPCPRGWRVQDKEAMDSFNISHSRCFKCEDEPNLNDWFYLTFNALMVLCLHLVAIDLTIKRRNFTRDVIQMHVCAVIEVSIASVLTLLINDPVGSLSLLMCQVNYLSDWYSFLKNPFPNYEEVIHCTHEVVYPRFTMILEFYPLCLLMMMLLRPWVARKTITQRGRSSIYIALFFFPILALIHAIGGGLIYFSYPYIVLILSLISSAAHFALKLDQDIKSLFLTSVTDGRNLVILLGHWCLHGFAILAITQLTNMTFHLLLLLLVPLPSLFYILTSRFSDPGNFDCGAP